MARRRILGDSVYEIRFLEMSLEDFRKYAPRTGILTETEVISIFKTFSGLDVPGLKWKEQKKRKRYIPLVAFSRFEVRDVLADEWHYRGDNTDALSLTVSKAVHFHGVRLFGDVNGSQYEVKFMVKDENVTGTYTSEQDNDGVWGYAVTLSKPVPIQPYENFTIIATIKGPDSYRGGNGKSSVNVNDIVVTFDEAPYDLSTNETNEMNGQFYKIFLSKL